MYSGAHELVALWYTGYVRSYEWTWPVGMPTGEKKVELQQLHPHKHVESYRVRALIRADMACREKGSVKLWLAVTSVGTPLHGGDDSHQLQAGLAVLQMVGHGTLTTGVSGPTAFDGHEVRQLIPGVSGRTASLTLGSVAGSGRWQPQGCICMPNVP